MNAGMLGGVAAVASSVSDLASNLRRSVVEIRSGGVGHGSGIVWGRGLVVTNAHCVPRGSPLHAGSEGTWHGARVIAYHPPHDLALLAVPSVSGPMLELRDAESLRPGELVFACGHPLGVRHALSMGVFHGVTRHARGTDPRWILAGVRLAPGNSGGPLVDAECRLVGINSMVVNGLGVAIPAALVQRFVDRVLSEQAA